MYGTSVFCFDHRGPTQSVCVADCYFIVNVLDLPFASPIAIYIANYVYKSMINKR